MSMPASRGFPSNTQLLHPRRNRFPSLQLKLNLHSFSPNDSERLELKRILCLRLDVERLDPFIEPDDQRLSAGHGRRTTSRHQSRLWFGPKHIVLPIRRLNVLRTIRASLLKNLYIINVCFDFVSWRHSFARTIYQNNVFIERRGSLRLHIGS